MRARWAVGLIVLTAACTAPSTAENPTAAASPSLTSTGTLPLTAVDFQCSLPVFSIGAPQLQDAFISFPPLTPTPAGSGGRGKNGGGFLPTGRRGMDQRHRSIPPYPGQEPPGRPAPTRPHRSERLR